MNKFKKYVSDLGNWANISMFLYGVVLAALLVALANQEPKPEPPAKVQEIVLEDGTKCVVLKGIYATSRRIDICDLRIC
jgi:hypothetical protein